MMKNYLKGILYRVFNTPVVAGMFATDEESAMFFRGYFSHTQRAVVWFPANFKLHYENNDEQLLIEGLFFDFGFKRTTCRMVVVFRIPYLVAFTFLNIPYR